jgi:hypothetical protein
MAPLPTVRKYQAEAGAVGQSFLQRSVFSNPVFEATGAHVASLTWRFFNKHLLCCENVRVNSILSEIRRDWDEFLKVYFCISYIACRMNSTRSLKIKIEVIRSQRFSTPAKHVVQFVCKVYSLEIKQLIERVVLCCIFSVFQNLTPNLEIRWRKDWWDTGYLL